MALVLPLLWQALEGTNNQHARNLWYDGKPLKIFMPATSSVMIKACFAEHCVPSVTWMISDSIHVKFTSWTCLTFPYSYTSLPLSECEKKLSSMPAYFSEHARQAEMIYILVTGFLLPNFGRIYIAQAANFQSKHREEIKVKLILSKDV